jgi:hypothetical protein
VAKYVFFRIPSAAAASYGFSSFVDDTYSVYWWNGFRGGGWAGGAMTGGMVNTDIKMSTSSATYY